MWQNFLILVLRLSNSMVSSESNDDGKSGEIVAVWQGEGALNGPTKYDIPASPFDSLPSLSLAPNDQGNPLQHEQNVLKMSSTIISAGPLKTSLTETEMYNAVFHEQTMEPHGRQIPSSVLGASHEQLPSALPSTFASTADSEVVTSLQDSLPYVPLHSDYTIVKDSYKTTFHKTRKEKRKRREIRKLNYKDLATVGKPKNSKKWAISSAGSKVLAVAEWYFPTDGNREVMSKAAFVKSRVRKGLDVDFIPTKFNGSTTTRTSRKRKNNLATLVDEHGDRIKNSLVQDVLFDTRYLQYDNSPYGFLDQLVRPSFVTIGNPSKRSDAWGEPYLKMIPDPPICLTKTSRVGAAYQVRVCRHRDDYHDKRNASYMPE